MTGARALLLSASALLLAGTGCLGQTGGDTIDFPVAAAGAVGAISGQPLVCPTEKGWDVTLTQATLHLGAIYLNQRAAISGSQATPCIVGTSVYVAQETSALNVELLSDQPQLFPSRAHGITDPTAKTGEVWLVHGDVNAANDTTPVLLVAGSATMNGVSSPFHAQVTIGTKFQPQSANAGSSSICKKRIVSAIPNAPLLQSPGGLLVRIDACALFAFVDFSQVPVDTASGVLVFTDDPTSPIYSNLVSTSTYAFSWAADLQN